MPQQVSRMALRDALAQIGEIHGHMSQATVFRGYRALPVAATGLVAIAGGIIQAIWLPVPQARLLSYVTLWIGVAAVSAGIMAWQLARRYAASDSAFERQGILRAVEQFAPCVIAGALLTIAIVRSAPGSAPLLPGLWSILFSLGIFSSWRRLPKSCALIGGFYLAAGVLSIALPQNPSALSPYVMGLTFGVGQLATAAVLYFTLEQSYASQ